MQKIVSCPSCGLLCDDIVVETQPNIKVLKNACTKGITFLEQVYSIKPASINGQPVILEEAIKKAAFLLSSAKKPLFSGLSTDVLGIRATYHLSQKVNGTLKHMNADSMQRNLNVLQNSGWQTTTLTEVKNRADVVVCIGTDIVSHNPRFFERFIWTQDALFTDINSREIIFIGEQSATEDALSPSGKHPSLLACNQTDLPEIMAVLRALLLGKKLNATLVSNIKISDLQTIADKLKQAKYAVLIWIAKDLDYPNAELTIQHITETVAILNTTTRAAGLSLGGSDGDTSANQTNTWLSGLPLNNTLYQHDLVVWVNSFNLEKKPVEINTPLIVFGHANDQFKTNSDVFIPIATPGLDCDGTLFRVDSSVILPLKKLRENNLLSLSEIVSRIEVLLE